MNQNHRTISRRLAFGASFLVVAGVAAVNSYAHMRDVALLGHQPNLLASTLPLSIDGLLIIASLAMAEDKANRRHPRTWARLAFWFGAVISLAANIASTAVHHGDPLSIGVASWPPLCLLVVIEIMIRPGKATKEEHNPPHAPAAAPTSPGYPPLEVDSAEAIAFREAQRELRQSSRLARLNG
jgi:Protein of unknown function (DUF2637)